MSSGVENGPSGTIGLFNSLGSGGLSSTIESSHNQYSFTYSIMVRNTSFCPRANRFVHESGLLERPPFEVLLVTPACDSSFMALLTSWLGLVTLQPFCLTCYTSCCAICQPRLEFHFAELL